MQVDRLFQYFLLGYFQSTNKESEGSKKADFFMVLPNRSSKTRLRIYYHHICSHLKDFKRGFLGSLASHYIYSEYSLESVP